MNPPPGLSQEGFGDKSPDGSSTFLSVAPSHGSDTPTLSLAKKVAKGWGLPNYLMEASLGGSRSDSSVSSFGVDSLFETGVKAGDFLKENKEKGLHREQQVVGRWGEEGKITDTSREEGAT